MVSLLIWGIAKVAKSRLTTLVVPSNVTICCCIKSAMPRECEPDTRGLLSNRSKVVISSPMRCCLTYGELIFKRRKHI